MTRQDALAEIVAERNRQERLKASGKFAHSCADNALSHTACLPVLAEEFGEVARAICEWDTLNLRDELIQTAAVCLAWLEGLEEKTFQIVSV
ncbi:MAG: hypothetical protein A4E20_01375 [Nitrospira sp. SG-bin2]|uniref:MazG nucleotide pyrophosphohydrolase domain-containing protein n=1 Tax=Nitrospira cf. moscoviensis SBR1015 TaxID=96242 RepID=UPI000A0EA915|nr:MazG nucleotide pyrophosphohydrolase domain-containing protein [Nitrospira cf. moscoviensis SBR1015]OQW34855.1 MAG: hypothetical protein A4E20_01375 [Nitrospira sp. SG-bin2]